MSYADDVTIGCARGFGEIYSDPDFLNAYGNYTLANAACAAAWQTETEAEETGEETEEEEYRCVEEDEELEKECERLDGQLCTMRVDDEDSGSSLLLRLCLPDECSGDEFNNNNDDEGTSLFAFCDNCSVEISCGGLSTGLLLLVILLPIALLLMAIAAWYSWRRRQQADAAGQASVEEGAKSEEGEEEEEEEEGTMTTMSHETEMTSGTTT